MAEIADDVVAVDEATVGVDRERPIGVTVEGDAHVRRRLDDGALQRIGVRRPGALVDVRAVGLGVEHPHVCAQRAEDRRRRPREAAPFAQSTTTRSPDRLRPPSDATTDRSQRSSCDGSVVHLADPAGGGGTT